MTCFTLGIIIATYTCIGAIINPIFSLKGIGQAIPSKDPGRQRQTCRVCCLTHLPVEVRMKTEVLSP